MILSSLQFETFSLLDPLMTTQGISVFIEESYNCTSSQKNRFLGESYKYCTQRLGMDNMYVHTEEATAP
jgi:hypothetical protein